MRTRKKGSFTIEAAILIPLLFFLFAATIHVFFYYHDKNILAGAAYETAVVGTERTEWEEEELKQYYYNLITGKLLWFPGASVEIEETEDEMIVSVKAQYRGMQVRAKAVMADTHPETAIRIKENMYENGLQK